MRSDFASLVGQLLSTTAAPILSLRHFTQVFKASNLDNDLSDGNEELIEGHGGIDGHLPGNRVRLHHLGHHYSQTYFYNGTPSGQIVNFILWILSKYFQASVLSKGKCCSPEGPTFQNSF